jgi:8-oxo-dGTP pyrophosphatase MutT (NUDIX family)
MFAALSQEVQAELAELARRYGQPEARSVELRTESAFDPLSKGDRYGEVCMVVRRKNGRLITALKSYYPRGAYRLLTGGINHGERVLDALLRETQEETGLQVEVRRFLVAIEYRPLGPDGQPMARNFYTFAFLLDELGGTLATQDPDERVEAFGEFEPAELPSLAQRLEALSEDYDPEISGRWRDWGHFRALAHRAVYHALTK